VDSASAGEGGTVVNGLAFLVAGQSKWDGAACACGIEFA
jgi:hypothetical protein